MQTVELAYYGTADHLGCLVELLVSEGLAVEHNPAPENSEVSVSLSLWVGPNRFGDAHLLDERVHRALSKFNARVTGPTAHVRPHFSQA